MTQLGKTSLLDATTQPSAAAAKAGHSAGPDRRKIGMIALAVVSIAVLGFILVRTFSRYQSSPGVQSQYRTLVDSETGEVFEDYRVPSGSTFPLKNPKTGKPTLYMGSACYWTKEGKAKLTPTWVFVRESIGEPGPTICPDCGRKVTAHNPLPPNELMVQAAQAAGKK